MLIKENLLFNTGFLKNSAESRIKQGLLPQELSNQCEYVTNPTSTLLQRSGGVCNNKLLYPFYAVPITYNLKPIKSDCSCIKMNSIP